MTSGMGFFESLRALDAVKDERSQGLSLVTVTHTFEAGHRLPHLPGKCQSLHGHSWHVAVTVAGKWATARDEGGVLLEFAMLKRHVRDWVDLHLDHGLMLGERDPLLTPLREHGKVYTIENGWPTVETVAAMLAEMTEEFLGRTGQPATLYEVTVSETPTNSATWRAAWPQ